MRTIYYTLDKEAGNVIDDFDTLKAAEIAIACYEEEDRANGDYQDDFYSIKKSE